MTSHYQCLKCLYKFVVSTVLCAVFVSSVAFANTVEKVDPRVYSQKVSELNEACKAKNSPSWGGFCLTRSYGPVSITDTGQTSIHLGQETATLELIYRSCERSDVPSINSVVAKAKTIFEAQKFFDEIKPQDEALRNYAGRFFSCRSKSENDATIANRLQYLEYMIQKHAPDTASVAPGQQPFQLSTKVIDVDLSRTTNWVGKHSFANVFCLNFPDNGNVKWLEYAMYNNNSLYHSRASYNYVDPTALYVATSTVPAGRSVETEIGNMEANNLRGVQAHPAIFKQHRVNGVLGPSLVLAVRNARDGDGKQSVFPFNRNFQSRTDGLLASLSVHRLFVRGSDRIEVAGLRYFKAPITSDGETVAVAQLTALVEEMANSLQSCTVNLPQRTQ
jgi:hypothetical protein